MFIVPVVKAPPAPPIPECRYQVQIDSNTYKCLTESEYNYQLQEKEEKMKKGAEDINNFIKKAFSFPWVLVTISVSALTILYVVISGGRL